MSDVNTSAAENQAHGKTLARSKLPEETAQPAKRPQLLGDYVPATQARLAQEDTALEVDIMILDFLAYNATKACLNSREVLNSTERKPPLRLALTAYEDYLILFKARQPSYKPDDELRLRILLLKFLALFTQRLAQTPSTPSAHELSDLRRENKQRAQQWIEKREFIPSLPFDNQAFNHELPLPLNHLRFNRATVLQHLNFSAEDPMEAFYGTPSSVALLDLLPLFMRISALRNSMSGSALNDRWMTLACDYMLQSCLEQYLVFGSDGTDAIDEAFSWGYKNAVVDPGESSHNDQQSTKTDELNDMFEDEDYATEVNGWSEIRLSYLEKLFNVDDSSSSTSGLISHHLQSLAGRLPIESFEEEMLKYLEAVVESIPQPILSQLDQGKLDGMSADETRSFLESCGVRI